MQDHQPDDESGESKEQNPAQLIKFTSQQSEGMLCSESKESDLSGQLGVLGQAAESVERAAYDLAGSAPADLVAELIQLSAALAKITTKLTHLSNTQKP